MRPRARHGRRSVECPDPLDPFRRRVLVAFGSVWVGVGSVRFGSVHATATIFWISFLILFFVSFISKGPEAQDL